MSVSSSAPQVVVVHAPQHFGLCHGELSLPPPSVLLLLPLLDPDSHPSILGADAILVSICAARCFNLNNCHPGLTSSRAKGGMVSAELAVYITGDEKFRRISIAGTSKLRFDLDEDARS